MSERYKLFSEHYLKKLIPLVVRTRAIYLVNQPSDFILHTSSRAKNRSFYVH